MRSSTAQNGAGGREHRVFVSLPTAVTGAGFLQTFRLVNLFDQFLALRHFVLYPARDHYRQGTQQ